MVKCVCFRNVMHLRGLTKNHECLTDFKFIFFVVSLNISKKIGFCQLDVFFLNFVLRGY